MPLFCIVLLEYIYSKGKNKMKAKTILILLLIAMLVFTASCDSAGGTSGPAGDRDPSGAQNIGSGGTTFSFIMVDGDGNSHAWNVSTNESTVGAALIAVDLIEGDVSDFGMMVSHVNGVRADFVEDDAWWAFYIDDEMAMVGVDSADIEDGVTYSFVYTPA